VRGIDETLSMDRPAGGGAAIPLEGMAMKKILLALLGPSSGC
jgi:hypothetical protein